MRTLTAAALFVAMAGTAARAQDDAAKAAKKLEGTYEVLGVSVGGKADDAKKNEVQSFVIKDGKLTIKLAGSEQTAAFKLDPSKKPAHIDINPDGQPDRVNVGVYEAKDTDKGLELTIAFTRGAKGDRPTDLSGNGDRIMLLKLLRKK